MQPARFGKSSKSRQCACEVWQATRTTDGPEILLGMEHAERTPTGDHVALASARECCVSPDPRTDQVLVGLVVSRSWWNPGFSVVNQPGFSARHAENDSLPV